MGIFNGYKVLEHLHTGSGNDKHYKWLVEKGGVRYIKTREMVPWGLEWRWIGSYQYTIEAEYKGI